MVLHGAGDMESWGTVVKISPTRGHMAMSGDIFDCHNQGKGCQCHPVSVRDTAKHPTKLRTGPDSRELSDPNCQWC